MRNYDNAYLTQFTTNVIKSDKDKNGTYVVLENTYFFPEGGGQNSDSGKIAGVICTQVLEVEGEIRHYIVDEITNMTEVQCEIDFYGRFRRMQNHTGEHIVSGIIHNLFGYNNVGFHLGEDDVTCDFDHELTKENIDRVEQLANIVVFENRVVNIFYPSSGELSAIEYRSKLDLVDDVRIVEINGIDKCACCAPHVSKTGEIGLIKILNPIKWKTGTRIHLKCGYDALYDYNARYNQSVLISNLLKSKQEEIAESVLKLYNDSQDKDYVIKGLKQEKTKQLISTLKPSNENIVVIADDADMDGLTDIVNAGSTLTPKYCVALSNTPNGIRFALKSLSLSAKQCIQQMKETLNVRGGGSNEFATGSIIATIDEIESFFSKI